jgi:hypothetical protein
MYPRREFTVDDHSKNLADLSLMPAAVLLVVPVSSLCGCAKMSIGNGGV